MNKTYLTLLHERIASTSIGASTARGMGPKGTVQAARLFLQKIEINRFMVRSQRAFAMELDAATEELRKSLPPKARKWGSARKFLNIFLRNCAYNQYLRVQWRLERIEPWLEVPLDSHVAGGLHRETGSENLPKWSTVISLKPALSANFQKFASDVAARDGVLRVHLDVKYWRQNSKQKISSIT